MSKFLPPKPYFASFNGPDLLIPKHEFEKWWDKEIVPLFENAVTAVGMFDHENKLFDFSDSFQDATHTASLVNIKPIKHETAEDLLRQIVNWVSGGIGCKITADSDVITKAKALLEKK